MWSVSSVVVVEMEEVKVRRRRRFVFDPFQVSTKMSDLASLMERTTISTELAPLTLPAELIVRIIQLSVPAPSYEDFFERSTILRSFSLVSSLWRVVSQELLFAHPTLTGPSTPEKFLKSARERNRVHEVKSIRFKDFLSIADGVLERTLLFCKEVEEVFAWDLMGIGLADFGGPRSEYQHIRPLCGHSCGVRSIVALKLFFPHLRTSLSPHIQLRL